MTAIALTLVTCWLVLRLAPRTPIGMALARLLVERPARRLSAIRRATVVAVLVALALGGAAAAIDFELLRVAAMAAPEAVTWLSMVEVGTLVDAALAAVAARGMVGVLRSGVPRLPRTIGRTRRARRRPTRSLPANDDEGKRRAA